MLADIVASNASRREPLRIGATDIAYSYLRFTSTVTYRVNLTWPDIDRPDIESIQSTLSSAQLLTNEVRGVGATAATVNAASPVDLSIVTTEVPAKFTLTLHMDACTVDEQQKKLCIVPPSENGSGLQPSFAAELSALLQVSTQRLRIVVTQAYNGHLGEEISVLITITPSNGHPGEPTTSAAVLLLNQYLESFESPLFRSQSWYSLVSRGLRTQLGAAADAAHDMQPSNDSSYNVTQHSLLNETKNSSWVSNATGRAAAPIDDGASWGEMPIDCRHFDSPGCAGTGASAEPEPELPEASISLSGEESPLVVALVIVAYAACAIVAAGNWLYRCQRKRNRARVISNYSSAQDDEEHTDRKPVSNFRSVIDSNDLRLVDVKHWRRRPPTRDRSDYSSSVGSNARFEAEDTDSAKQRTQQWVLAPEQTVRLGNRVQVTGDSNQLGRIGTSRPPCVSSGCI
jgi:hypothetical protein